MGILNNAIKELRNINKFDYSWEYSEEARRSHKETGKMLTSAEHSKMSAIDFGNYFSTKEKLIKWYFEYLDNINQVDVISAVGNEIKLKYRGVFFALFLLVRDRQFWNIF